MVRYEQEVSGVHLQLWHQVNHSPNWDTSLGRRVTHSLPRHIYRVLFLTCPP